ncbi:MAG TPA: hypothetical protein VH760_09295 [Gaiellaceae bacterium]
MPASAPMPRVDLGGIIRPQVRDRVIACEAAASAGDRAVSDRILLAQMPAHVDTTAAPSDARTGERKDRAAGPRKPSLPVPPVPADDRPAVPAAPGSSLGSGGSGGMNGKDVSGVVTAPFSLIPPRNSRPVTLFAERRLALRLFFILERPG